MPMEIVNGSVGDKGLTSCFCFCFFLLIVLLLHLLLLLCALLLAYLLLLHFLGVGAIQRCLRSGVRLLIALCRIGSVGHGTIGQIGQYAIICAHRHIPFIVFFILFLRVLLLRLFVQWTGIFDADT